MKNDEDIADNWYLLEKIKMKSNLIKYVLIFNEMKGKSRKILYEY